METERETTKRIARLLRFGRKRMGLNQTQVARDLGISQSALSKMEAAVLVPSAPQWYEFCALAKIPPDSLMRGYVENPALAELRQDEVQFHLGKYGRDRGSKIKATLPVLEYARACLGDVELKKYLKSVRVDGDYFVDIDNQISVGFMLDVAAMLISAGKLQGPDLRRMLKPIFRPEFHGSMIGQYHASDMLDALEVLVGKLPYYTCNTDYVVENYAKSTGRLTFSCKHREHMGPAFRKRTEALGDFFCAYAKEYFLQFATSTLLPGPSKRVSVEESECFFHGDDRCVYTLAVGR